jgi:membrane protease YdiL (CAAX protease family)
MFSVLALILRKFKPELKEVIFIMMILPIIRFLGSLLPVEGFSFPVRIVVTYLIMFILAIIMLKFVDIKQVSASKFMKFMPIAIIFGFFLGWIEYFILKPEPAFQYLNINTFAFGILIMMLTGFAEELIFRGLIQNLLLKIFNVFAAIITANIIFMSMHLIWLNPTELIFVFFVGIICGWIYYKTRNLILISVFHGMINFSLFVFSPLLGA